MTMTFSPDMKLRDIVNQMPAAANVFREHRIDFCCGGNRTLEQALKGTAARTEDVLQALREAGENRERLRAQTDWTAVGYGKLVEHITDTYHADLKETLPALSEDVTKIMRVHGTGHPELFSLHQSFHEFKTELEQHMAKEEQDVFPLIRAYAEDPSPSLLEEILEKTNGLEAEHREAGEGLRRIRQTTADYALPPDACMTYRNTFERLKELERDMFDHIHLENNVLFPRLSRERTV